MSSLRKYIQRSFYSFLSTKFGFTVVFLGAVCIINTLINMIHFPCSTSNSVLRGGTVYCADTNFADNIGGRHIEIGVNAYGPIDIVYTWVNGSDPIWLAKKEKWSKIYDKITPKEIVNDNSTNSTQLEVDDSNTANRYRDSNELQYSLRSLEKYAPWIRNIYIVTDNQIPYWLNLQNPRIHIVSHMDIFPNKSHLPVFSSPAIETHLHRIPGLSKYFIYFNDDVFLGAPTLPEDFVSVAGVQRFIFAWDVPKCAPGCAEAWIGDGYCDKACNVSECNFDFPDCAGGNATNIRGGSHGSASSASHNVQCSPGCVDNWLSDRVCDVKCKTAECGYDLGDCGMKLMSDNFPGVWMTAMGDSSVEVGQRYSWLKDNEIIGYGDITVYNSSGNDVIFKSSSVGLRDDDLPVSLEFPYPLNNAFYVNLSSIACVSQDLNAVPIITKNILDNITYTSANYVFDGSSSVVHVATIQGRHHLLSAVVYHQQENAPAVPVFKTSVGVLFPYFDTIFNVTGKNAINGRTFTIRFKVRFTDARDNPLSGESLWFDRMPSARISGNESIFVPVPKIHSFTSICKSIASGEKGNVEYLGESSSTAVTGARLFHKPYLHAEDESLGFIIRLKNLVSLEGTALFQAKLRQLSVHLTITKPDGTQFSPPSSGLSDSCSLSKSFAYLNSEGLLEKYGYGSDIENLKEDEIHCDMTVNNVIALTDDHLRRIIEASSHSNKPNVRPEVSDFVQFSKASENDGALVVVVPLLVKNGTSALGPWVETFPAWYHVSWKLNYIDESGKSLNIGCFSSSFFWGNPELKLQAISQSNSSNYSYERYLHQNQLSSTPQYSRKLLSKSVDKSNLDDLPEVSLQSALTEWWELVQSARPGDRSHRRLIDTYASSLVKVNRLYNKAFGVEHRKVPAHVPHMINRDVMFEMQKMWEKEWNETSTHRFRSPLDMQYSFSYYYFVINRYKTVAPSIEGYLSDEIDTNHDGVIDHNEFRTLAALVNSNSFVESDVEKLLVNCTLERKHLLEAKKNASSTSSVSDPSRRRLMPSDYDEDPVVDSEHPRALEVPLLTGRVIIVADTFPTVKDMAACSAVVEGVKKYGGYWWWPNNPSHVVGLEKDVAFEMIGENLTETKRQLDSVRFRRTKFVCINDNVKTDLPPALADEYYRTVKDFYDSFFPIPSQFELPKVGFEQSRNPTLYIEEYRKMHSERTFTYYINSYGNRILMFLFGVKAKMKGFIARCMMLVVKWMYNQENSNAHITVINIGRKLHSEPSNLRRLLSVEEENENKGIDSLGKIQIAIKFLVKWSNAIFIAIFCLVFIYRWLSKRMKNSSKKNDPPSEPPQEDDVQEKIRRRLSAGKSNTVIAKPVLKPTISIQEPSTLPAVNAEEIKAVNASEALLDEMWRKARCLPATPKAQISPMSEPTKSQNKSEDFLNELWRKARNNSADKTAADAIPSPRPVSAEQQPFAKLAPKVEEDVLNNIWRSAGYGSGRGSAPPPLAVPNEQLEIDTSGEMNCHHSPSDHMIIDNGGFTKDENECFDDDDEAESDEADSEEDGWKEESFVQTLGSIFIGGGDDDRILIKKKANDSEKTKFVKEVYDRAMLSAVEDEDEPISPVPTHKTISSYVRGEYKCPPGIKSALRTDDTDWVARVESIRLRSEDPPVAPGFFLKKIAGRVTEIRTNKNKKKVFFDPSYNTVDGEIVEAKGLLESAFDTVNVFKTKTINKTASKAM